MAKSKKGRTSRKSKRKSRSKSKRKSKRISAGKCPPGYIERAGFMRSSYNRKGEFMLKARVLEQLALHIEENVEENLEKLLYQKLGPKKSQRNRNTL